MPVTWIEVADTFVKIGLGAVIAGVSGYTLAERNHKHALTRELSATKIRLLELSCNEAEKFFSYTTSFYNLIGAFARSNDISSRDQTAEEIEAIAEIHEGLQDALLARNKAMANIALLEAKAALWHLAGYSDTLERLRTIVAYNSKMLSKNEHDAYIDEFRSQKIQFYSAAGAVLNASGKGQDH